MGLLGAPQLSRFGSKLGGREVAGDKEKKPVVWTRLCAAKPPRVATKIIELAQHAH